MNWPGIAFRVNVADLESAYFGQRDQAVWGQVGQWKTGSAGLDQSAAVRVQEHAAAIEAEELDGREL